LKVLEKQYLISLSLRTYLIKILTVRYIFFVRIWLFVDNFGA